MSRIFLLFAFLISIISVSEAQTSLAGKVLDNENEVIIGATVRIFKDGVETDGNITNDYGNFIFSNVTPGTYEVRITYTGYADQIISGVLVSGGKANRMTNILLESADIALGNVTITAYRAPLIEQDNTTQGTTITSEQIAKAPVRSIQGLVAASAGASSGAGGISIRGSRTNSTDYYIDGIRVSGGYLPPNEIEQLQVITGGIEAQYGDVTGGVIVASTKGPSSKLNVYLDGETSKWLDPYERTEINTSVSGPILKNKDGRSVIGFRVGGRFLNFLDDNPSYAPLHYMKSESISNLESRPIFDIGNGTIHPTGEFNFTDNSFSSRAQLNEQRKDIDLNGKLDFRLTNAIDVQLGGGYSDIKNHFAPSRAWAYANYQNNPIQYNNRYRLNARLRHKLSTNTGSNSGLIQDVSYTLIGGYEKTTGRNQDLRHEDRIFDYGYIGKFGLNLLPLFEVTDTGTLVQLPSVLGVQETPYTPGTQNPVLAGYNSLMDSVSLLLPDEYIINNGLTPRFYNQIFNLYSNVGQVYNTFSKSENETYTGRLDINFNINPGSDRGIHSINMGFLYEQSISRSYNLAPRGLWNLANTLSNSHLKELDPNSPSGEFVHIAPFDTLWLVNMLPQELPNAKFYKSLRQKLGVPLNEVVFTNNLSPNDLSLDMFSPSELYFGNLISFYGYDYLGNKVNNASFNDFFTRVEPGQNNVRSMLLAPFKPIYQSFYIQDKFQARDVIFRLGLRVERYDANTKVLKDQYSLYEMSTAQEYYNEVGRPIPSNINPNSVVYLNTFGSDASGVKAYRMGDTWFNAEGVQTLDPNNLFDDGVANPRYKLLADEVGKPDIQLVSYNPDRSFKDYVPQVNLSPRIAISFPISDDANFFGHYDVLVQRPTNNFASGLAFLNWENVTEFNNPDLKPEKNIDYEIGFQQKLTNSSALKLSVYYKEIRDLIQSSLIDYTNNSSGSLLTYRNIDFSTVKGLQLQYDLRRTGNLSLQANYTLQFADGTGSDANTQRNLAKNGSVRVLSPLDFDERHAIKLNLDYRFEEGKTYNGPELFGLDILSNTGLNVIGTTVSGRPYTKQAVPNQFGSSGSIGTYNGARYPWNFNLDLRVDKSFDLTPESAKNPIGMNVYVRIANVLNTQNIYGLYRATSSPHDDGFLQTEVGKSNYFNIVDDVLAQGLGRTQADYINAYNWMMYNPGFFSGPRRIFIGASINF